MAVLWSALFFFSRPLDRRPMDHYNAFDIDTESQFRIVAMPLPSAPPPVDQLPASAGRPIPLNRLRPGESAVVRQIRGRLEDVYRLEEFGVRDGVVVEMFRPGTTCILRLRGGKVCLRPNDSLEILVAPTVDAAPVACGSG